MLYSDLKPSIDAQARQAMLSLAQANPFLSRLQPSSNSVQLPKLSADFLKTSSPTYKLKYREMSPPIFRRSQTTKRPAQITPRQIELKGVKPVDILESDVDFAKENMAIVDGWTTVHVDSSGSEDTPSLSSGTSEVDELDDKLWLPSSASGSEKHGRLAEDLKMDVPVFPRSERPGGGKGLRDDKEQRYVGPLYVRLFSDFVL